MASNGTRVTLAVLGQRMDDLTTIVKDNIVKSEYTFKEIQESLDGCDEYPGVRGRLLILEQSEKIKKRHLGYVWGILSFFGAERLLSWISSLPR